MNTRLKRAAAVTACAIAALSGWLVFADRGNAPPAPMQTAAAFIGAADPPISVVTIARSFRKIEWDELMPPGWDPAKSVDKVAVDRLKDGTARASALMRQMRAVWDEAPTVPELEGASVKIPGYMLPLQEEHGRLTEFLLVPYFGACIHTPPPPANQIIHVFAKSPLTGYKAMDAVWISGTIRQARDDSFMGTSGYKLSAEAVEHYEAPNVGSE